MQQIVDTKKVTIPHTNLTSLTGMLLQTQTQHQQKLMGTKQLMSPIGHIVDIVRLYLEFLEESPKTRSLQRVDRLFLFIYFGRFLIRAYICCQKLYNHKNEIDQVQVHTNSTCFSVIFNKWSVEVFPERGSCFMRIQQ